MSAVDEVRESTNGFHRRSPPADPPPAGRFRFRTGETAPAAEPVTLGEVIPLRPDQATSSRSGHGEISSRLESKFGVGDQPRRRRDLYRALAAACDGPRGEDVYRMISEAVMQAVGARNPGRYFTKAITAKLREAGLNLLGKEVDASW